MVDGSEGKASAAAATVPAVRHRRLIVVSDLHISAGPDAGVEHFFEDDAFAAMLAHAAAQGPATELVLLGDFLDLVMVRLRSEGVSHGSLRATLQKLDAVGRAHPLVFRALGAFASAGHTVHVVPGNHDVELLAAPVQDHLRALVADAAGDPQVVARITFHPWIVHVPGVLYGEHGQQHHDINHLARLLTCFAGAGSDRIPPPPGALLDELRLALAEAFGRRSRPAGSTPAPIVRDRPGRAAATAAVALADFVGGLARAGAAMSVGERAGRRALYENEIRRHAVDLGLPEAAVVAIDRTAAVTPRRLVRRLVRWAAARSSSREPAAHDYMVEAARRVDALLSGAGARTPFYVFGHTHLARDEALHPRLAAPRYLNAGTWSTMVRSGGDRHRDRLRFIEIDHGDGRAAARLRRWDAAAGAPAGMHG